MNTIEKIFVGILIVMMLAVGFNAYEISSLKKVQPVQQTPAGNVVATFSGPDVIPKGTPYTYGSELGVQYDDVSSSAPEKTDTTIRKLGVLDQQLTLSGSDQQRYIAIVRQISCEYCCGADSIITPDGRPSCGCAHSYAMRGLAKYLIRNHGTEYTNDQILEELGKWKTLFFPGQITAKAKVLQQKGVELNYINLASNKYSGIEKVAGNSQMVGGC